MVIRRQPVLDTIRWRYNLRVPGREANLNNLCYFFIANRKWALWKFDNKLRIWVPEMPPLLVESHLVHRITDKASLSWIDFDHVDIQ
jgi:hypothetical protein